MTGDDETQISLPSQTARGIEDDMRRLFGADCAGIEHDKIVLTTAEFVAETIAGAGRSRLDRLY